MGIWRVCSRTPSRNLALHAFNYWLGIAKTCYENSLIQITSFAINFAFPRLEWRVMKVNLSNCSLWEPGLFIMSTLLMLRDLCWSEREEWSRKILLFSDGTYETAECGCKEYWEPLISKKTLLHRVSVIEQRTRLNDVDRAVVELTCMSL